MLAVDSLPNKMISVYYTTWSAPWVSDSKKLDLANIVEAYPGVDCVNISFAQPDMTYTKGSFSGTGLQFSMDFDVVVGAIKILKSKGVTVMLSVGGGSYWSGTKYCAVTQWVQLANDLGCDGIDIDWENGAAKDYELTQVINDLHAWYSGKISFAGFSTGAYGKDGSDYKGMCIDAMVNAGDKVDWINIMTYDAGPTFDPLGALDCYRIYYPGPLNIGFEVGVQAWGGYLLTRDDVINMATYSKNNNPANGIFIWCLGKAGNPSVSDIISICSGIFAGSNKPVVTVPVPLPPPTLPVGNTPMITCGVCNTVYLKK
jgi:hypothetical protein